MSLLYAILNCSGNTTGNTALNYNRTVFVGDSILAAYACRPENLSAIFLTTTEISAGKQAFNLAVPGHTILQQQNVWIADTQKATYDLIVVQMGPNDMTNAAEAIAPIIARYQTLIDTINAGKKAGAKVLVSCVTPLKSRWANIPTDPVIAQAKWVALNDAIMNVSATTNITGVDYRNNGHVTLLGDGQGNLAAQYDCGDGAHTTSAANVIIKNAMRAALGI